MGLLTETLSILYLVRKMFYHLINIHISKNTLEIVFVYII